MEPLMHSSRRQRLSRIVLGAVATLAPCGWAGVAAGQAAVRDFTDPILVHNGGGHAAELYALCYADERVLLSAGMDKVVNVWDFSDGRERLAATIRPPIFRGARGAIFAMALAPVVDGAGQRLLAVAGYGAEEGMGGIEFYSYPGQRESGTSAPTTRIAAGDSRVGVRERRGHVNSVNGLSFAPDGRYLASCSNDATVRVWDLRERPPTEAAVLEDHVGPVQAVAFLPGGRLVASAGDDGRVRLWDWRRGTVARSDAPGGLAGDALRINALVVDPAGGFLVAGREDGHVERYTTADLRVAEYLNEDDYGPDGRLTTGAVEALAISPDGRLLACSVLKYRSASEAVLPRTECDIVIRRLPDGARVRNLFYTLARARALAFSPDGRRLAVGGGHQQAVYVADPRRDLGDQQLTILRGGGSTLWDVGFLNDEGTAIAYARARPLGPDGDHAYEGFDLAERSPVSVDDPARLRRALETFEGWSVRPTGVYTLEVLAPDGEVRFTIDLDRIRERRWFCYSFLPPAEGRDELMLAVGCEGGVILYRAGDGRKTRVFSGHAGFVLGMAPSADGRWLATASDDQTVRLWSLAGVDQRPAFGATLRRDDRGDRVVDEVVPGGHADKMGLDVGDRVGRVGIEGVNGNEPIPVEQFLGLVDDAVPNRLIYVYVRRGDDPEEFPVGTTKRDSPLLSFYPGTDREWVIWMPEGYYDTSIAGDHRLLGWHVNPPANALLGPTRFYPLSRYEEQLRQPAAIDLLLRTANHAAAVQLARGGPGAPAVATAPPPAIAIAPPPAVVQAPALQVTATVTADPARTVRAVRFRVGTEDFGVVEPAAPAATLRAVRGVTLRPGENLVRVEAADDQGVTNVEAVRVVYQPPEPPPAPELVIRSIGVPSFGAGVPPIPTADDDAEALAGFLAAPTGRPRFPTDRIQPEAVGGTDEPATGARIAATFEALAQRAESGELGAGDSVFVVLESHFFVPPEGPGEGPWVLGSDAAGDEPRESGVDAGRVAEVLGELADRGCLVVLLLDGLHRDVWAGRGYNDWVRDLAYDRGVIVAVASKDRPSVPGNELGVFARAVLESVTVRGRIRPAIDPDEPILLMDFQAVVPRRVQELTARQQVADVYYNEDGPLDVYYDEIALFDPQLPAPVGFAANE